MFGTCKVEYYLNGDTWNKTTSLAPCPAWLCKNGFDEDKAVFAFKGDDSEMMDFADASFCLLIQFVVVVSLCNLITCRVCVCADGCVVTYSIMISPSVIISDSALRPETLPSPQEHMLNIMNCSCLWLSVSSCDIHSCNQFDFQPTFVYLIRGAIA